MKNEVYLLFTSVKSPVSKTQANWPLLKITIIIQTLFARGGGGSIRQQVEHVVPEIHASGAETLENLWRTFSMWTASVSRSVEFLPGFFFDGNKDKRYTALAI